MGASSGAGADSAMAGAEDGNKPSAHFLQSPCRSMVSDHPEPREHGAVKTECRSLIGINVKLMTVSKTKMIWIVLASTNHWMHLCSTPAPLLVSAGDGCRIQGLIAIRVRETPQYLPCGHSQTLGVQ